LIKTAALPASTIGPVKVPFRGRILNVAGDRTFESWTVTIINDTDFAIRSALENWINSINRVSDATGATDPALYQADAFVYQLDRNGETLRAYHMYDIFPTNIAQIALSSETTDAIEEFTCEFQVQWWEAVKGTGTNAGGLDIN
jgi:type IV secretory pathway TrbF-like protein